MTTFFTSDHHFHHRNILKFEDRPFKTIEDMNEGLIDAWNDVVKENDTVHHLGDFCFGNHKKWKSILDRLNGKIILYKGNHDDSRTLRRLQRDGYFKEVHPVGDYIKSHKFQLWLTHYPMEIGMRPRKYSIHGHIHGVPSRMLNQINVGIDSQFNKNKRFGEPVSEDELISYIQKVNPLVEEKFQEERRTWKDNE